MCTNGNMLRCFEMIRLYKAMELFCSRLFGIMLVVWTRKRRKIHLIKLNSVLCNITNQEIIGAGTVLPPSLVLLMIMGILNSTTTATRSWCAQTIWQYTVWDNVIWLYYAWDADQLERIGEMQTDIAIMESHFEATAPDGWNTWTFNLMSMQSQLNRTATLTSESSPATEWQWKLSLEWKLVCTRGQNTDGSAVVLTMLFVDVPNKEMSVFFMLIWLYKPLHLAPCSRSHGNYAASQAESDEIPRCAEKKLNECNVWTRSGLSVCVCGGGRVSRKFYDVRLLLWSIHVSHKPCMSMSSWWYRQTDSIFTAFFTSSDILSFGAPIKLRCICQRHGFYWIPAVHWKCYRLIGSQFFAWWVYFYCRTLTISCDSQWKTRAPGW